jgi:MFS family permease
MPNLVFVGIVVALCGLDMPFTQALFSALVADAAPPELRGTAFGYFNLLTGLAMLAASVIAGALWDAYGPAGTFLAGLVFALVTLFGLLSMSGEISSVAGE